jgi:hypothetical protein
LDLIERALLLVLQVIQTYARANKLPLDVMMFTTEVTNKTVEQVTEPAPLGCYIHGCVLEGARCAQTASPWAAAGTCSACLGQLEAANARH